MAKQITQEQIDLIIDRLNERVDKANEVFLKAIGKSIDEIGKLTPTKAHQLAQILKYGENYQKIIKQLDKYTNMDIQEIDEIFNQYAKQDMKFYEEFYKYRNIPFREYKDNAVIRTQTEALSNMVKNEMYNFTRSNVLGYSIRDKEGRLLFSGLKETYNKVLDTALMNVGQGKETFDSAMSNILKDIGSSGLKTIDYESGRSVRLDSAIRMHLKSKLGELHNENQKVFGREFGADGYEISVHLNPAIDHEEVQGRQFSIAEYDILNSGGVAKDYKGNSYTLDHDNKNGYRPISELNCYHYIFPIILGVSNPEYSDEELQKIRDDNNAGFELDGKHYTNYEGTQLQRSLERKIREQKDIQILAKESGNLELVSESQKKITQLSQKYKELSEVSGLPTKMKRMKVSGYKRIDTKYKDFSLNRQQIKNLPNGILKYNHDVGEKYFPGGTNESMNSYVRRSAFIWQRARNNEELTKTLQNEIEGMRELKTKAKTSFTTYMGISSKKDLKDIALSTSLQRQTANLYKELYDKNGYVVKIEVPIGADIISTYGSIKFGEKYKHFENQAEIILLMDNYKLIEMEENYYRLIKR